MPTSSFPNSDLVVNLWENESGSTPLWTSVDDLNTDANYITCTDALLSGDPDISCSLGLQSIADPGIDTGHVVKVWCAMAAVGIGFHGVKVELYAPGLISTWFISQNSAQGIVENTLTVTTGEASGINYSNLSIVITRLHDGSDFTPRVYGVVFQVPAGFTHLDISGGGVIVSLQESGFYLLVSGGGVIRVSGTETTGAFILDSGAGVKVKT